MKRTGFQLSTLLFVVAVIACSMGVVAIWSSFAVSVGIAASFAAALITQIYRSRIPKSWRVILWSVFGLHVAYIASIGPSAFVVAKINRPKSRNPTLKRLFMDVYGPVGDAVITGPGFIRSAGCGYINFWLPTGASIRLHDDVGIILRHDDGAGLRSETYLCVKHRP